MLYQLNNDDGESAGLLETTAVEDIVQRNWKKVSDNDYTDKERTYIENYCGSSGECGVEELEALLDLQGYKEAERVFATEINNSK